MLRKVAPLLLLTVGALLQISPAGLVAYRLEPGGLIPVLVPYGMVSLGPIMQDDLDGNGTPETLELAGGHLSIYSVGQTVWKSPPAWHIEQAVISDLNHDGLPEVTLLLWRPFRPWPVDQWLPYGGRTAAFHNAEGLSCHIILIGWIRGAFRELWAGSPMADPIVSFAIAEMNDNQSQELVALEGRYSDSISDPARTIKIWEWNGFGFTVVSSMDGIFNKMTLVRADDGPILILVP
jgi:hypothetical protein